MLFDCRRKESCYALVGIIRVLFSTCRAMPFPLYPGRLAMPVFKKTIYGPVDYQNRQTRSIRMMSPRAPNGPYCFSSSSQLIRTAARLYLAESSRSRDDISPVKDHVSSPLYLESLSFVVPKYTYPSSRGSLLGTASLRYSLS